MGPGGLSGTGTLDQDGPGAGVWAPEREAILTFGEPDRLPFLQTQVSITKVPWRQRR